MKMHEWNYKYKIAGQNKIKQNMLNVMPWNEIISKQKSK